MVTSKQLVRRSGGILLLLSLLVRSLMPVGYMPGDLMAGDSLLVVCPSGLPESPENHSHHHGNAVSSDDEQTDTDGGDLCPFALALNPIASVSPPVDLEAQALQASIFIHQLGFTRAAPQRRASIRAPPRFS